MGPLLNYVLIIERSAKLTSHHAHAHLCVEVDADDPADERQDEEEASSDWRALPVQALGDDVIDEQQDEVDD